MTKADMIAALRANHLKANVGWIEALGDRPMHVSGAPIVIHWDRAWIDPGGTVFGPGPYLHVPITSFWGAGEETTHRVYPPARLRRRLASRI
jgi:hypothetical protein